MEEPQPQPEPITYVGGLGEPPKRHAWPYIALSLIPVVLAGALVVFWNPINSIGKTAGQTIAPYSLTLIDANWTSDQKIAGVPNTLSLSFANTDQRTAQGMTLRFTRLDQGWEIVNASSGNTSAQVQGTSIFFKQNLPPRTRTTISVTLLPTKPMNSEIDVTLTPDHGSTPAQVDLGDGTQLSTLKLNGNVRAPRESDADARLTALYPPEVSSGEITVWSIHVANTGPVTINNIRLSFPDIPPSFEFRIPLSQGVVLPDGATLEYHTTLPPGGQTILVVGVLPHEAGHFVIPIYVFLGASTEPLSAANGGPPVSVDLTVS